MGRRSSRWRSVTRSTLATLTIPTWVMSGRRARRSRFRREFAGKSCGATTGVASCWVVATRISSTCIISGHVPRGAITTQTIWWCCAARTIAPLHDGKLAIEGAVSAGLVFKHGDGTSYGQALSPQAQDASSKLFAALRRMGFGESETRRALDSVRVKLGGCLAPAAVACLQQYAFANLSERQVYAIVRKGIRQCLARQGDETDELRRQGTCMPLTMGTDVRTGVDVVLRYYVYERSGTAPNGREDARIRFRRAAVIPGYDVNGHECVELRGQFVRQHGAYAGCAVPEYPLYVRNQ